MIIPIPADQIAFSEIVPRKIRAKATPKVLKPAIEESLQVTNTSSPTSSTDIKSSININHVLLGIAALAVFITVIYLINKHQENKAKKVHPNIYK